VSDATWEAISSQSGGEEALSGDIAANPPLPESHGDHQLEELKNSWAEISASLCACCIVEKRREGEKERRREEREKSRGNKRANDQGRGFHPMLHILEKGEVRSRQTIMIHKPRR